MTGVGSTTVGGTALVWFVKLKARTHWAVFPSADSNSRPIPVGRFKRVQNIKHV